MVDISVVMDGMMDLKMFMTQKFDAHDMQFQELNHRWDNLGCSPSSFYAFPFPNPNDAGTSHPNALDA